MKRWMTAIVAMAKDRVIGCGGGLPWHLPEDFRFFKATTMGGVLVMGRRTYESIGHPLPGRRTVVVSASGREFPGTMTVRTLEALQPEQFESPVFLCGGAALYQAGLPLCRELLISHVRGEHAGDTLFPPYEEAFVAEATVLEGEAFTVVRYVPREA